MNTSVWSMALLHLGHKIETCLLIHSHIKSVELATIQSWGWRHSSVSKALIHASVRARKSEWAWRPTSNPCAWKVETRKPLAKKVTSGVSERSFLNMQVEHSQGRHQCQLQSSAHVCTHMYVHLNTYIHMQKTAHI